VAISPPRADLAGCLDAVPGCCPCACVSWPKPGCAPGKPWPRSTWARNSGEAVGGGFCWSDQQWPPRYRCTREGQVGAPASAMPASNLAMDQVSPGQGDGPSIRRERREARDGPPPFSGLRRLKGIDRPAIGACSPPKDPAEQVAGAGMFGANMDARPAYLHQSACWEHLQTAMCWELANPGSPAQHSARVVQGQ